MQKKKSNDIREYLLLLYHLRDAGESWTILHSLKKWDLSRLQFMHRYKECKEMDLLDLKKKRKLSLPLKEIQNK